MPHRLLSNVPSALAALLLFLLAPDARAQNAVPEAQEEAMREAFTSGDARAVLAHAAGRVEVDLPTGSSQYSRSQAVYVLQKFFENHPPRRFAWRGASSQGRSRFLMGRYWHETSEQPLAVYLHLTNVQSAEADDEWQLQEVRLKQL
jgi:hypothetical protein